MDATKKLNTLLGKNENVEHMLYGTVNDDSMQMLLSKLQGFCDHANIPPQPFHDHEIVYIIRKLSNLSSCFH